MNKEVVEGIGFFESNFLDFKRCLHGVGFTAKPAALLFFIGCVESMQSRQSLLVNVFCHLGPFG